jgi:hypothetical protein
MKCKGNNLGSHSVLFILFTVLSTSQFQVLCKWNAFGNSICFEVMYSFMLLVRLEYTANLSWCGITNERLIWIHKKEQRTWIFVALYCYFPKYNAHFFYQNTSRKTDCKLYLYTFNSVRYFLEATTKNVISYWNYLTFLMRYLKKK